MHRRCPAGKPVVACYPRRMGEFLMGLLAIPLLAGWFYLLHWLLTVVGFFRR